MADVKMSVGSQLYPRPEEKIMGDKTKNSKEILPFEKTHSVSSLAQSSQNQVSNDQAGKIVLAAFQQGVFVTQEVDPSTGQTTHQYPQQSVVDFYKEQQKRTLQTSETSQGDLQNSLHIKGTRA